ncbi:hypothetical protein Tco_0180200 [Tanacetum coccineum]
MPPGLPASVAEVEALSDSTFLRGLGSFLESSPSSSSLELPSRKRYWGGTRVTTEEDEGPAAEVEGLLVGDEGLAEGLGPRLSVEGHSLGRVEALYLGPAAGQSIIQ